MPKTCRVVDLGLTHYSEAYREQLKYVELRKEGTLDSDILIITEHQDVYTYGRKSKEEIPPHLKPIAFEVERGGEATFHNPGQIVCYPILLLRSDEQDVHLHLRRLEEWIVEAIAKFDIQAERREGATGVWIKGQNRKIASVGVAVKGWVTYHGVALNVRNDLSGFQRINPCGFDASVMTNMLQETAADLVGVREQLVAKFPAVFGRQLIHHGEKFESSETRRPLVNP